jgi:putative FmdB family regulatory protein
MPTYEYRCRACHESFSIRERISEYRPGQVTCPKCHSRDVERLMSDFYAKTARKS